LTKRHYLIETKNIYDPRGRIEIMEQLPFRPKRVFVLSLFDPIMSRGDHALRECEQLFFLTSGIARFEIEYSPTDIEQVIFDDLNLALYIPPLAWRTVYGGKDTTIVCLASHEYDPDGYINSRDELWKILEAV